MKPLFWVSSTKKCVVEFPEEVRSEVGHALYLAQRGDKGINTVPMVGFGGASVLEVVINDSGDAYRAVYTVRFRHAIYVLHAFQKKSKSGIATPLADIDLIKSRLRLAEADYNQRFGKATRKGKTNDRSA